MRLNVQFSQIALLASRGLTRSDGRYADCAELCKAHKTDNLVIALQMMAATVPPAPPRWQPSIVTDFTDRRSASTTAWCVAHRSTKVNRQPNS